MIGKIKGIVEHIYEDSLIIDNQGIGYLVYCSTNTLLSSKVGLPLSLFTQMVIKEEQMSIYGFLSEEDKSCFNLLQTVQGVGAKVALNIQSHLSNQDIYASIMAQDTASFRQVNGIGPKLAERIVNELKSSKQLSHISNFKILNNSDSLMPGTNNKFINADIASNDAISALVALGYNRRDVFTTVQSVISSNARLTTEDLIKLSLKKISGM